MCLPHPLLNPRDATQPIFTLDGNVDRPPIALVLGSIMVAFGSCLANGCTSGHGLSGTSRFSMRSIVFTCTFMGFAFAVSAIYHSMTNN